MSANKPKPKPTASRTSTAAKSRTPTVSNKVGKAPHASEGAKPRAPSPISEHRAYPALVHELLTQIPVTLADDERAYYEASITEADALRDGTRYESSGVLDDILQLAARSLPHVVAALCANVS